MARIRYLKPEFFEDEEIAELSHTTRLCFQGLWVLADKAGRLHDKPRWIKIKIFPYENIAIETQLDILSKKPFIQRYTVDGCKYIQVLGFEKHQRPHHTEKESTIPPYNGVLTVKAPLRPYGEGNGEGNGEGECSGKKPSHPPHVFLKEEDQKKLTQDYGATIIKQYIDKINDYISSKGKKPYKDYAAAIRSWMRNDNVKKLPPKPKPLKQPECCAPTKEQREQLDKLVGGIGRKVI